MNKSNIELDTDQAAPAKDLSPDTLPKKLEASIKRRRDRFQISEGDLQRLRKACEDIHNQPDGLEAASKLKWIFESQSYLAAEGNFDLFCTGILGLSEDLGKKLLALVEHGEKAPAAPGPNIRPAVSPSITPACCSATPGSDTALGPKAVGGESVASPGVQPAVLYKEQGGPPSLGSEEARLPSDFDSTEPVIGTWEYARDQLKKPRPPSPKAKEPTKNAPIKTRPRRPVVQRPAAPLDQKRNMRKKRKRAGRSSGTKTPVKDNVIQPNDAGLKPACPWCSAHKKRRSSPDSKL